MTRLDYTRSGEANQEQMRFNANRID